MTKTSQITDQELIEIKNTLSKGTTKVYAWQIKQELANKGITVDESTIRGRFISLGQPLSGRISGGSADDVKPEVKVEVPKVREFKAEEKKIDYDIPNEMKQYIPAESLFLGYLERPVDKRLEIHYNSGKYPITQGKQGTGKTYSHMYYAYKQGLPFFLFNGYEDFKLQKHFGDKTIENGSLKFQENLMVKAIQCPSVILFDEFNAISNANTFDFHAMLQNRELFIKDADNGKGKTYKLHPHCRIGFAQNPKSAKYIGGNIKPSNFLGRCTFITYPEFTPKELRNNLTKKYPNLTAEEIKNFILFYKSCCDAIEKAELPLDISIRQLHNVIDLYTNGLSLEHAIEDGLTSMLEAISQPRSKDAFFRIAQAIWKDLMVKDVDKNVTMAFFMKRKVTNETRH